MTIHVMVADDEPIARDELLYLLHREDDLSLCPAAQDGQELLELIDLHHPDVVFLDIEMPRVSGIDVAKHLSARLGYERAPLIVFTTAYENHALEAFSLDATDYLLKPYDDARFAQALARVRARLRAVDAPVTSDVRETVPLAGRVSKVLVDDGEKIAVVSPPSIRFAVRLERHVEIHTDTAVLHYRSTLSDLQLRLAGWPFFRSHRGYLVNTDCIQEIVPWVNGAHTIILNDRERTRIPVSRAAVRELLELLMR